MEVAIDNCFLCLPESRIEPTFGIDLPFITNFCRVPKIKHVLKDTMPFLELTSKYARICWNCLQELTYSWIFQKSINTSEALNLCSNNNCRICGSTFIKCHFTEQSKELEFYKILCKSFNTSKQSLAFCCDCYEKLFRCFRFSRMGFYSNERIKKFQRDLNKDHLTNQNENNQYQSKTRPIKLNEIPTTSSVITNNQTISPDFTVITRISTNNPSNTQQTMNNKRNNLTIELRSPLPYKKLSHSGPLQENNVPTRTKLKPKMPCKVCPNICSNNTHFPNHETNFGTSYTNNMTANRLNISHTSNNPTTLPTDKMINNEEHSQQDKLPNLNKHLFMRSGIMNNIESEVNPINILQNIVKDNLQSFCTSNNASAATDGKINKCQPNIQSVYPNKHISAVDYQEKENHNLTRQFNRIKHSENQPESQPVHSNTVSYINSSITEVTHTSGVSNYQSTEQETLSSSYLKLNEELDLPETEDTYELILNDTSIEFQISENQEHDEKQNRPFEWNESTYQILYETMLTFNLEFAKDGIPRHAEWVDIYEKFKTSLEGYDGFIYIQGGWEKLIRKAIDFLKGHSCSDMTSLLEKVVALTNLTPESCDLNDLCTVDLEDKWLQRSIKTEANEDNEFGFTAIDHGDFIEIDVKNEIIEILKQEESLGLEIKKWDISSTENIFYPNTKDKFKATSPSEDDSDDDVIFIPN